MHSVDGPLAGTAVGCLSRLPPLLRMPRHVGGRGRHVAGTHRSHVHICEERLARITCEEVGRHLSWGIARAGDVVAVLAAPLHSLRVPRERGQRLGVQQTHVNLAACGHPVMRVIRVMSVVGAMSARIASDRL